MFLSILENTQYCSSSNSMQAVAPVMYYHP